MGLTVASGSEGNLTASAEWKGNYSDWDDDASLMELYNTRKSLLKRWTQSAECVVQEAIFRTRVTRGLY
jgi:hypothetical protein